MIVMVVWSLLLSPSLQRSEGLKELNLELNLEDSLSFSGRILFTVFIISFSCIVVFGVPVCAVRSATFWQQLALRSGGHGR